MKRKVVHIDEENYDGCGECLPGLLVEVHTIGIRGGITRSVVTGPEKTEGTEQ